MHWWDLLLDRSMADLDIIAAVREYTDAGLRFAGPFGLDTSDVGRG